MFGKPNPDPHNSASAWKPGRIRNSTKVIETTALIFVLFFSDDTDEIVGCDSCGISVHEACYGIQASVLFQYLQPERLFINVLGYSTLLNLPPLRFHLEILGLSLA
jgi:hypothetical protein